jgi:hypothetical protein
MSSFYVFITAVTPLYKESVVFEMLSLGYTIAAVNTESKVCKMVLDSEVSALIYFEAAHEKHSMSALDVTNDASACLKKISAKYHSIVTSNLGNGSLSWTGANFKFPEETK